MSRVTHCTNPARIPRWPEIAKSDHILYVFSGQGDQIELISFAMSQAPFGGPPTIFFYEFFFLSPNILLYIGHHIRYLLIL
jgi:hypothetical protein